MQPLVGCKFVRRHLIYHHDCNLHYLQFVGVSESRYKSHRSPLQSVVRHIVKVERPDCHACSCSLNGLYRLHDPRPAAFREVVILQTWRHRLCRTRSSGRVNKALSCATLAVSTESRWPCTSWPRAPGCATFICHQGHSPLSATLQCFVSEAFGFGIRLLASCCSVGSIRQSRTKRVRRCATTIMQSARVNVHLIDSCYLMRLTVNDRVYRVQRLVLVVADAASPCSSLPSSTGELATAEMERKVREKGPS